MPNNTNESWVLWYHYSVGVLFLLGFWLSKSNGGFFLTKRGAKLSVSFVGDFLPPWIVISKFLGCSWTFLFLCQVCSWYFPYVEFLFMFFMKLCILYRWCLLPLNAYLVLILEKKKREREGKLSLLFWQACLSRLPRKWSTHLIGNTCHPLYPIMVSPWSLYSRHSRINCH